MTDPTLENPSLEAAKPRRRRLRWWHWVIALVVLAVLGSIVVWFWREMDSRRRVDQRLAEYRAAGEWATIEDYNAAAPPPDHLNAAIPLRAAGERLPADERFREWMEFAALPLTEREIEALQQYLTECGPSLDLLAEARRRPLVDWDVTYPPTPMDVDLRHLNDQRTLSFVLRAEALLAQTRGATMDALDRAEQMLYVADAVDFSPGMVSHLVAFGIRSDACYTILEIDDHLTAQAGDEREKVEHLIAMLLHEPTRQDAIHRTWTSERAANISATMAIVKPWTLKAPWVRNEVLHMADLHDGALTSSIQADVASAMASFTDPPRTSFSTLGLANTIAPSLKRTVDLEFRLLTERRVAATSLAIRLYEIDHGQLPESLEVLVPDYLPDVPLDPFAPQVQPLGYDRDRDILWSAGSDGIDEGGDPRPPERHPTVTYPWQTADAVFLLKNPPRRHWLEEEE